MTIFSRFVSLFTYLLLTRNVTSGIDGLLKEGAISPEDLVSIAEEVSTDGVVSD